MPVNREFNILAEAELIKAKIPIAAVIGQSILLQRDGRRFCALCPFHVERTPSFYVYPDHFHCFGCGVHGDVFEWLMKACGMTFREAVRHLAVGLLEKQTPALLKSTLKKSEPTCSATKDLFLRCWDQGVDPAGTVAETYLRNRGGLAIPDGAPIRFHASCQRGPSHLPGGPEFLPAMLALMTDPITGRPVGLHRTYLLPDGSAKAPMMMRDDIVLKSKMIMGTWGVVRLAPDEEVGRAVGIAEGIENALTAMQVIGWGPTWAVGTQNCIRTFPILPWIEAVTIFADADDSGVGLSAARACAARWDLAGREVRIHVPPDGQDWNDAAQRLKPHEPV